jgi:hypothetical protein
LCISDQSLSNKFYRDSYSGEDLIKIVDFLSCELSFIMGETKIGLSLEDIKIRQKRWFKLDKKTCKQKQEVIAQPRTYAALLVPPGVKGIISPCTANLPTDCRPARTRRVESFA